MFLQPGKLTKIEMKTVFGQLVEADKVMRARLQVIQVACETGWKTAKNLAAVHSGDPFISHTKMQSLLTKILLQGVITIPIIKRL